MSNALALAAVTAVIQYELTQAYAGAPAALGGVTVAAGAPAAIQTRFEAGDGRPLVNVFLYRVTPAGGNLGAALPIVAADGTRRLPAAPLALDLHYLLTFHASDDTVAEALLGYAALRLHDNPVLTAAQIDADLAAVPAGNPLAAVLSGAGLAQQVGAIVIAPVPLTTRDIAGLWPAFGAAYRLSYAFTASTVVIEGRG